MGQYDSIHRHGLDGGKCAWKGWRVTTDGLKTLQPESEIPKWSPWHHPSVLSVQKWQFPQVGARTCLGGELRNPTAWRPDIQTPSPVFRSSNRFTQMRYCSVNVKPVDYVLCRRFSVRTPRGPFCDAAGLGVIIEFLAESHSPIPSSESEMAFFIVFVGLGRAIVAVGPDHRVESCQGPLSILCNRTCQIKWCSLASPWGWIITQTEIASLPQMEIL